MEQARVVGILDVLEHQLPIARDPLPQIPEHDELAAVEDAVEIAEHRFAEIKLERFGVLGKAGEHDAVAARHREALQPMLLRAKIGRHAALTSIAAAERHAEQFAAEIIGPLVIGADKLLGRAAVSRAELRAAVGAAIEEDIDFARRVADRDHLPGAEPAALEVSGIGNLRLETDIEPARAGKDAFLLEREDPGIGVDPIRDARGSGLRPSAPGGGGFQRNYGGSIS